ncbi:type II toxin-antitoxin system VapC family toxin [Pollutimonas sp. M17]|uniref:type II toxin-antitoxin system VapC family toxin n=1 Tax=Pollutimonas sp. M17 TaxID=2962065 RepID=UPI0021F4EA56|nr:PIN domain-containing protein [Pollutimonas sp. M17]UYO95012.1 PIN domain-containing protein [Pollutimonas sp. M17]
MIAFFDACTLIYLIEGKEPFAARVRGQLAALSQAHPDAQAAISRLSWPECRVGPMKSNDLDVLARYDAFFARQDIVWVELNRQVVELAAAIRVRHGLRTPDALQAASCLQLGADHLLLTGDPAFERVHGLNVAMVT